MTVNYDLLDRVMAQIEAHLDAALHDDPEADLDGLLLASRDAR